MLYWIIIGVLIVGIIAVIFFTVSKLLKEKKDYNQFERRYHSREDDYDDDYDDDDDEEDDYEPEPRRRPARQQSECRTSSAPAKRRWKMKRMIMNQSQDAVRRDSSQNAVHLQHRRSAAGRSCWRMWTSRISTVLSSMIHWESEESVHRQIMTSFFHYRKI